MLLSSPNFFFLLQKPRLGFAHINRSTTTEVSYLHGSQNRPQSTCWRQPIHFPQGPFDTTAACVYEEHKSELAMVVHTSHTHMNKEVEGERWGRK